MKLKDNRHKLSALSLLPPLLLLSLATASTYWLFLQQQVKGVSAEKVVISREKKIAANQQPTKEEHLNLPILIPFNAPQKIASNFSPLSEPEKRDYPPRKTVASLTTTTKSRKARSLASSRYNFYNDPVIDNSPYRDRWYSNLARESRIKPQQKAGTIAKMTEDTVWRERVNLARKGNDIVQQITNPSLVTDNQANTTRAKTTKDTSGSTASGRTKNSFFPTATTTEELAKATEDKNKNEADDQQRQKIISLPPFNALKVSLFLHGQDISGIRYNPSDFTELNGAISGPPDFANLNDKYLENNAPTQKIISLGIGGEITLEVVNNGILTNGPGIDIIVYENPFYIKSKKWRKRLGADYFIETGQLEVYGVEDEEQQEDSEAYRWYTFPCEYQANDYFGCAGAKLIDYNAPNNNPLSYGGDHFDLEDLGLAAVKKILIRDIGGNILPEELRGPGKDGFDLDSIALLHAQYTKEEENSNEND